MAYYTSILHDHLSSSKYGVRLNNTANKSIQFSNSIGMNDPETKEVYSGSTQLDISYGTFCFVIDVRVFGISGICIAVVTCVE